MYHYNYVLFNNSDNKTHVDHTAYYTICAEDLYKCPEVNVVSFPLDSCKNKLLYKLYRIHCSQKISKHINLRFKSIWYPYFFHDNFSNKKPYCFIFISREYPLDYFKYLKQHYENCKIVLMHRDLLKVCERCAPGLANNKYLDLEMSYDINECRKYNMFHFDEFESKIDVPDSQNYPESDVFFAGNAKDRLPLLLEVYDKIKKTGYKCKYYLTGVPRKDRVELDGIEYADSFMPYSEMLYHSINSKCILEINQSNADGYTSRFLEAVMFNKKLITNNPSIVNSKFYTPKYIQIFSNPNELDMSFIGESSAVDYKYNNEFSPLNRLNDIDNLLTFK